MWLCSNKICTYDINENTFEFLPGLLLFVILGIGSYLGITFLIDLKTRKFFKAVILEIKDKKI